MGEPAYELLPAEEEIGQEAVKQTTKLVLINGGKVATPEAAEGVATIVGEGVAALGGAALATIVAVMGVLLYPSSAGESEDQLPASADNKANNKTNPLPKQSTASIQKCPNEYQCPPHDWGLSKKGFSFQDALNKNKLLLDALKRSPSQKDTMRGRQFENDALILNNRDGQVESVGDVYVCSRCGEQQEVDIVFKDGQIAESKSAKINTIEKKSKQTRRLLDLQSSINCKLGGNHTKPLAKLDNSLPDSEKVKAYYEGRGFEIESLDIP